jgi:hypothetical protein
MGDYPAPEQRVRAVTPHTIDTTPGVPCQSFRGCDQPSIESGLCLEHLNRARAVMGEPPHDVRSEQ